MKGFYKITDEKLDNEDVWDILKCLDQGTQRSIDLILSTWLINVLVFIKDCESPIERMLAVGLYDCEEYWSELAKGKLNINVQQEIMFGKKVYRVDFQINAVVNGKEKNIVIECDGHDYHERTKEQARKDKQRDRDLTKMGYIVIRFTGSEIYNDVYKCMKEIKEIIFDS